MSALPIPVAIVMILIGAAGVLVGFKPLVRSDPKQAFLIILASLVIGAIGLFALLGS